MKLENLEKYLHKYGTEVVKEMTTRLEGFNKRASGKLINSIDYRLTNKGESKSILFEMIGYGYYVDKGRKPSKLLPPIKSIKEWCKNKGIPEGAAYPIAKKIAERGVAPTNFFTTSTKRRLNQFYKNSELAFQKDLKMATKEMLLQELKKAKPI